MPIFKSALITTLVTNIFTAGVLNKFLGAMRPIQIVAHLLMFKIIVPANVMIFMEAILPIIQYDYLEPYWSDFIVKVFQFDVEAQELQIFGGDQKVTDQIITLGYENQCSLLNLGSITFYLSAYFAKLIIFFLIMTPLKSHYSSRYDSMREELFYQDLVAILTESFLEIYISGYLSVYQQR